MHCCWPGRIARTPDALRFGAEYAFFMLVAPTTTTRRRETTTRRSRFTVSDAAQTAAAAVDAVGGACGSAHFVNGVFLSAHSSPISISHMFHFDPHRTKPHTHSTTTNSRTHDSHRTVTAAASSSLSRQCSIIIAHHHSVWFSLAHRIAQHRTEKPSHGPSSCTRQCCCDGGGFV